MHMYYGQGYAGNASRRYAAVHTGSRIEGASPHMLVRILFDEALLAIDASMLARDRGDLAKTNEKHARAMSIIHALDASLDFENGGDIAVSLAQIYREAQRLMIAAAQGKRNEETGRARVLLAEIAEAWNHIGQS